MPRRAAPSWWDLVAVLGVAVTVFGVYRLDPAAAIILGGMVLAFLGIAGSVRHAARKPPGA
jgi:Sec-independent protein translocase protein TatA